MRSVRVDAQFQAFRRATRRLVDRVAGEVDSASPHARPVYTPSKVINFVDEEKEASNEVCCTPSWGLLRLGVGVVLTLPSTGGVAELAIQNRPTG